MAKIHTLQNKKKQLLQALMTGIVILMLNSSPLYAASGCEEAKKLVSNGSLLLLEPSTGRALCELNSNQDFPAASTIKILTSLLAINILGADYHFKTDFWLTLNNELIIEGYGDPFLVSEEINAIAIALKNRGITKISRLILNTSRFDKINIPGITDSIEPYDAPNGALMVNFNTVFVKMVDGDILSAEEQTPITPLVKKISRDKLKNNQELRFNLGPDFVIDYSAELFTAILQQQGITISNPAIINQQIENTAKLVYTHYNSRTLSDNLKSMLRYSNNMQANQIFLTLGAASYGYPANLADSVKAAKAEVAKIFPNHAIDISEGSGIDRRIKISAAKFGLVLLAFEKYSELLDQKSGNLIKSGTLTGVYNFAGYLTKEGKKYPFVIFLNQNKNNRNEIVKLLAKHLPSN